MKRRGLLLVDHGSREPEAGAQLERVAREVSLRRPDLAVYVAHLEQAAPSVAEALAACAAAGISDVIVHPFFLAPGRHAARDLPRALADAARAHPDLRVRVTEPVGASAGIAELILATLPAECE